MRATNLDLQTAHLVNLGINFIPKVESSEYEPERCISQSRDLWSSEAKPFYLLCSWATVYGRALNDRRLTEEMAEFTPLQAALIGTLIAYSGLDLPESLALAKRIRGTEPLSVDRGFSFLAESGVVPFEPAGEQIGIRICAIGTPITKKILDPQAMERRNPGLARRLKMVTQG